MLMESQGTPNQRNLEKEQSWKTKLLIISYFHVLFQLTLHFLPLSPPTFLTPTKHKSVASFCCVYLLTWHLPIIFLWILLSCPLPLHVQIQTDTIYPYMISQQDLTLLFSLSTGLQIFLIPLCVLITFLLFKLFLQPDCKCQRSSRLRIRAFVLREKTNRR